MEIPSKKNKSIVRKYYPHSTGHFLGLETHDAGDYKTPFLEGEVFAIEPGIYILEEGLGIRIENNVVINDDQPIDLMANIPIEAEEIEDLMNP